MLLSDFPCHGKPFETTFNVQIIGSGSGGREARHKYGNRESDHRTRVLSVEWRLGTQMKAFVSRKHR